MIVFTIDFIDCTLTCFEQLRTALNCRIERWNRGSVVLRADVCYWPTNTTYDVGPNGRCVHYDNGRVPQRACLTYLPLGPTSRLWWLSSKHAFVGLCARSWTHAMQCQVHGCTRSVTWLHFISTYFTNGSYGANLSGETTKVLLSTTLLHFRGTTISEVWQLSLNTGNLFPVPYL